jgi:hypothetical protein
VPAPGARHILPAAAQGAWAGQPAGRLAVFGEEVWTFVAPRPGWLAWVVDVGRLQVFDGTNWIPAQAAPSFQNLPQVGIGTAADATNRLAVAGPATLLTHGGAGHQVKVNKATATDTASLLFQSGWSGRAEMGLTGSDDFRIKVSADGATFHDAMAIDRGTGRVELAAPLLLPTQVTVPSAPADGRVAIYARSRAGQPWIDVQRPSGRHFPLQPHFGVNRIATWAPSSSTTVNANGMPRTAGGVVTTPNLTMTSLATSMRRWRVTSDTAAGASAQECSSTWVCWRGNAAGLGGFTYVNRLALVTLQPTGLAFFGLMGSAAALSGTLQMSSVINALGIGFEEGTHANWQILHNDGIGAPTLIDLGNDFAINSPGNVLTVYIAAAANSASVGIRVVEEVSGIVAEATLTSDLPADSQMLSPRNYMNNGSTAAAVSYDCSGVYIETDY